MKEKRSNEISIRKLHRIHIGTQRAGSTYLRNLLLDHSDLTLSNRAEVGFFNKHFDLGAKWYSDTFPDGDYKVDISPAYFKFSEIVPKRMHAFFANPDKLRLSLILRNPIDYVASHFHMHKMRGHFEQAPKTYPDPPETLEECIKEYPEYLERGRYDQLLDGWLEYFDRNQIKIFLFEDFIESTDTTIKELLEFWEVPDPDKKLSVSEASQNSAMRYKFLYQLRDVLAQYDWLKEWLKNSLVVQAIHQQFFAVSPSREVTKKEQGLLKEVFEGSVDKLETDFSVNTEVWKDFN
jgi:hypothetical protein